MYRQIINAMYCQCIYKSYGLIKLTIELKHTIYDLSVNLIFINISYWSVATVATVATSVVFLKHNSKVREVEKNEKRI